MAALLGLNILLLVVNLTDLRYVWINYEELSPQTLSQYVHAGTYLLLLAVLLAMGVLLWYFRANLNFYPNSQPLRILAFVWLAQNALLAFSVGLRNWQYVQHYGLTYRRLGVFAFLLLVSYGLYSVYRKVRGQRTIAYLLRRNGWTLVIALLLGSAFHWDGLITRYNIASPPRTGLDVHLLFHRISDKNLPILYDKRNQIAGSDPLRQQRIKEMLQNKAQHFQARKKDHGWWAWNYRDWRTARTVEQLN